MSEAIKQIHELSVQLIELEHQRHLATLMQNDLAKGTHQFLIIDRYNLEAQHQNAYFQFSDDKAVRNNIKLALDIEITALLHQIEQVQRKMHNFLGQNLPAQP